MSGIAGEVVVPACGVVERVGAAQSEHPRVAAVAVEPVVDALVRLVLRLGEPADEHRCVPAVREVERRLAHDALGQLVARQAAVAVLPAPFRRDHVRRVARDQVERLAGDRLEEAAQTGLDVVDPVQRGADLRERERPCVHVGRDHVIGVRCGEERVGAVAGADVQRALDAAARRQRREPVRRRREAGHPAGRVVLPEREAVEGQIDAFGLDDAGARHEPFAVRRDEADGEERLDAVAAERSRRVARVDGALQEEQADRRGDRRAREAPLEHHRLGEIGGRAVLAEQLLDHLGRVPDGAQSVAERRRSVEVGVRVPGIHEGSIVRLARSRG